MDFYFKLVVILGILVNTYSFVNINKCKKKINLGIYLINLRMKPYSSEIINKKKELDKYSHEFRVRKEMILRNNSTKNSIVHTTLDSSYEDFFDEEDNIFEI